MEGALVGGTLVNEAFVKIDGSVGATVGVEVKVGGALLAVALVEVGGNVGATVRAGVVNVGGALLAVALVEVGGNVGATVRAGVVNVGGALLTVALAEVGGNVGATVGVEVSFGGVLLAVALVEVGGRVGAMVVLARAILRLTYPLIWLRVAVFETALPLTSTKMIFLLVERSPANESAPPLFKPLLAKPNPVTSVLFCKAVITWLRSELVRLWLSKFSNPPI